VSDERRDILQLLTVAVTAQSMSNVNHHVTPENCKPQAPVSVSVSVMAEVRYLTVK